MATTTIKSGWFSTETATYFVAESGNVYVVQSDDRDLSDGPARVAGMPRDAAAIDPLLLDADLCAAVADLD